MLSDAALGRVAIMAALLAADADASSRDAIAPLDCIPRSVGGCYRVETTTV